MVISYSDSFSNNQYWTVKTRRIQFIDEKEFTLNLTTDVGLTVEFPPNWTVNPSWTPEQKAANFPMYQGFIALNVSSPGSNYNFGSYYLSSLQPEINLGRFSLLTGSAPNYIVLSTVRLRTQLSFPFGAELLTFSNREQFYNVRHIRMLLNATASGTITINLPIPI